MANPEADRTPRLKQALTILARFLAAGLGVAALSQLAEQFHWVPFSHDLKGAFLYASVCMNVWLVLELVMHSRPRTVRVSTLEMPLADQIVRTSRQMYDAGDYSAVIRYRDAFSRMLWIEGHLEQRLKLGDITEDAAIKLGNLKAQIASLIDDLGWTSVALGRYEKAVGFLKHGLRLAEAANEYYWSAKAHRHLGGLYVEKRDYPRAYEHLTAAMEEALKVPIEPERNEMVAGIEYGLAITAYSGADYEVALKHLETSNRLRRDLGDESRTVRIYAMIGKIYEAKNDLSQAKDNFRKGIREAKRVGRVDEEIRNLLGLARVLAEEYRLDGTQLPKKEESDRCQAQAAELMQLTPIPLELSLNEVTHRRAITREGKQHG